MTDKIFIRDLQVETLIGVWEWEKTTKQCLLIDLEIAIDAKKSAKSGKLEDTLDYAVVSQRITEFVSQGQFPLIEMLAEDLAELLFKEFRIPWLRLQIIKSNTIQNAKQVGIIIERSA